MRFDSGLSFAMKGMSLCPGKNTSLLISNLLKRRDREIFFIFCRTTGTGKKLFELVPMR